MTNQCLVTKGKNVWSRRPGEDMRGVCVAIGKFQLGAMKISILIAGYLCLYRTPESKT